METITSFPKAFLLFSLISLSMVSSLEASTGFVAPLIHITSPEHPLYNPLRTRADIVRYNIRVSHERHRHFSEKRQNINNYRGGVAPITYDVVMKYYIGTPPMVTYAFPDTGCDVNWLQCESCHDCFVQEAVSIFDPAKSSTYQLLPCSSFYCKKYFGYTCSSKRIGCQYNIKYFDNTTSRGAVAMDTIILPGDRYKTIPKLTIRKTIIGCRFYNKGPPGGFGGVIGLQNVSTSLPRQMGVRAFSYCKSDGGDGGYIRFGSYAILVGEKVTLFTDRYGQYQSILIDVIVAGTKLNLSREIFKMVDYSHNTGVMIDMGMQYTRLNSVAYEAMANKIKDIMIGHESYGVSAFYDLCYNALDDDTSVAKLPSVHFLFDNNVTLKMPNENVWSEEDSDGNLCLKIFKSPFNMTVIGAEQLESYNVGFDLKGKSLWLNYEGDCRY